MYKENDTYKNKLNHFFRVYENGFVEHVKEGAPQNSRYYVIEAKNPDEALKIGMNEGKNSFRKMDVLKNE